MNLLIWLLPLLTALVEDNAFGGRLGRIISNHERSMDVPKGITTSHTSYPPEEAVAS
jgi:hypothetical protein